MNWEAIGAIGEIIGAIAVLITLIYLAGQIRQSNKIALVSTELGLRASGSELNRISIDNYNIIELYVRGMDPTSTFTEDELLALQIYFTDWWNKSIANEVAYKNGFAPEETYRMFFDTATNFIGSSPVNRKVISNMINIWPSLSEYDTTKYLKTELEKHDQFFADET